MPVLLDTNVLFATASAGDVHHGDASEIVAGIDHGELPTGIVTNYVVAETLNLTREKLGANAANALLDRLIEGANFEIRHAAKADFTTAQALFRRYPALSFVDATIVACAQRTGEEYLYSFDDDFDRVETITRLASPTDPL